MKAIHMVQHFTQIIQPQPLCLQHIVHKRQKRQSPNSPPHQNLMILN
jgi:hypothetical protein